MSQQGGQGAGYVAGKLAVLTAVLIMAGCGGWQGVRQGIYEGARVNRELATTPSESVGKQELPADYDRYERMRREVRD